MPAGLSRSLALKNGVVNTWTRTPARNQPRRGSPPTRVRTPGGNAWRGDLLADGAALALGATCHSGSAAYVAAQQAPGVEASPCDPAESFATSDVPGVAAGFSASDA
jgi:hypothetical protein